MYELSAHPSTYYLALYKKQRISIQPNQPRDYRNLNLPVQPEQGIVAIEAGELEFEIYFEVVNSAVDPADLRTADAVLAQVVDMDAAARSFQDGDTVDYEEQLAYIVIAKPEIELHYFATTVNTEWGAYFERDAQGTFRIKRLG